MAPKRKNTQDEGPSKGQSSRSPPASPANPGAQGRKRPASPTQEPAAKRPKKAAKPREFKGRQCATIKPNGEQCRLKESATVKGDRPEIFLCRHHRPKTSNDEGNQQPQDAPQPQQTETANVAQDQQRPDEMQTQQPAPVTDNQQPITATNDQQAPEVPSSQQVPTFPVSQDAPVPVVANAEESQSGTGALPPAPKRKRAIKKKQPPEPTFARTEPSTDSLPDDFNACQYLRQELDASKKAVSGPDSNMKDASDGENPPVGPRRLEPLSLDDVYLAISSVTAAITRILSRRQGFSFFRGDLAAPTDPQNPPGAVVLPDRPLLLPFDMDNNGHVMLVTTQYDESVITINVNDPMAWDWTPARREEIYAVLREFIDRVGWRRAHLHDNKVSFSSYANWAIFIDQIDPALTSYCTIISAWAMALGLEQTRRTDPFSQEEYDDLIRVIELARAGRADWRLIYAFLVCRRFVEPHSEVPLMRRFSHTEPMRTDKDLEAFLKELEADDQAYWNGLSDTDRQIHFEVGLLPRVRIDRNWPHNTSWICDSWVGPTRETARLENLFNAGVFNTLYDDMEMYAAYRKFKAKQKRREEREKERKKMEEREDEESEDEDGTESGDFDDDSVDDDSSGDDGQRTESPSEEEEEEAQPPRPTTAGKVPRKVPRKKPAAAPQVKSTETADVDGDTTVSRDSTSPSDVSEPVSKTSSSLKNASHGLKYPKKKPYPAPNWANSDPSGSGSSPGGSEDDVLPSIEDEEAVEEADDASEQVEYGGIDEDVNALFESDKDGEVVEDKDSLFDYDEEEEIVKGEKDEQGDHDEDNDEGEIDEGQEKPVEAALGEDHYSDSEDPGELVQFPSLNDQTHQLLKQFQATLPSGGTYDNLESVINHVWNFLDNSGEQFGINEDDDDWCLKFRRRFEFLQAICAEYPSANPKFSKNHKLERDRFLNDAQIDMAIGSVIGAINVFQHQHMLAAGETRFTGGLGMVTSAPLSEALLKSEKEWNGLGGVGTFGRAAHPRRCFLMPVILDKHLAETVKLPPKNAGHICLFVLQEETREVNGESGRFFCVYCLDSGAFISRAKWSGQPKSQAALLYGLIQKAARNLSWTRRNSHAKEDTQFLKDYTDVPVLRQADGTSCGLFTVLNAWILALGLTPNAKPKADARRVASKMQLLVLLAWRGALDWKTLVAFLLCHGLVTQTSMSQVPLDRRFGATMAQEGQAELSSYYSDVFEQDDAFLQLESFEDVPYDYSCNVNFPGSGGLQRGYDDFEEYTDSDEDRSGSRTDWRGKQGDAMDWLDSESYLGGAEDQLDWLDEY
ncbi:uncharacterized protein EI97DRAFT_462913 [Westerdykella ornata]|uniref:Ubiquitin-like protease family profile domain-containing protein n=1 Tax=Westerdykella ornata TaxID=318751 RepID=A0A6A6J541_WESOR|nr:uncharacterized protein EI97DRAFT_462913 [Westerdykella ornata]KAF2271354.1 hypothetical protein EI97DRAFT_462913 [Westerdykella ornata]